MTKLVTKPPLIRESRHLEELLGAVEASLEPDWDHISHIGAKARGAKAAQ